MMIRHTGWFLGACAVVCSWAASACSSDPSNGGAASGGNAGSTASGAGGSSGSAGAVNGGAAGASGSSMLGVGGGIALGGAASGGSGGLGGLGNAGNAGAAGSAGGPKNCAGNAISLASNGTGTASDAARARVEIDLQSDLPVGNAPRTIEFWLYVKPSDWLGEKNEIYVYGSPGTTNTAFGLDFGTNAVTGMPDNHATLNPYTNGSFTVDSQNDLGVSSANSQWLHVAMSWDGSSFRTYVNGDAKIVKTDGSALLATTSSALTLGCNPPIFNCFNGYFDELRVWNVARTAVDIKANYARSLAGNEAGLVGYWKFDEAPGATSAKDSVSIPGHTMHVAALQAATTAQQPAFITPDAPAPILCP